MAKLWSNSNKGRHDPIWALYASLFLHALSIVVLSRVSDLDLTIGPETKFDIVWLSPSSTAPTASTASASPAAASDAADAPTPAVAQREAAKFPEPRHGTAKLDAAPAPSDPDADMHEPAFNWLPIETSRKKPSVAPATTIPAPKRDPAPPLAAKPVLAAHPAEQQKESARKAEALHAQSKVESVVTADHEPLVLEKEEDDHGDMSVLSLQAPQIAKDKEKTEQTREQLTAMEAKTQRSGDPGKEQQIISKQAARPHLESLEPKRAILPHVAPRPVVAASQKPLAPPAPAPAQFIPVKPRQEPRQTPNPPTTLPADNGALNRTPQALTPQTLAQASASPAVKPEDAKPKPAEKPPEKRGIVVASIRGDLKMVIAGDSGIRLSVVFREYPKARRSKALTRSEARRELKIVPVIAKTRQDTREAVIETAREGIYVFSAESEKGEAAKAIFTLKIFEAGAREKVTAIGARTVSSKAVLTKILMPDGIVWDDDSAFTGSLEDSESTTKFNAQTGLYWKEYND